MKPGHIIAAAVLLAPIPFAGMTNPAAASSQHTVVVSGHLTVTDAGGFPRYKKHIVNFNIPPRTFTLTHSRPFGRLTHRVCAGGETRGELRVQVLLQPSQSVDALAEVRLYEESTCENLDLEGKDWESTSVPPGQTRQISLAKVNHEHGSWDTVEADITVHQKPILPPLIERYSKLCAANPEACKVKIG